MSRHTSSLGNGYFNALYAAKPDPWQFADSAYEKQKYAASLDALPSRRFTEALEVGCSIGIFTRALAERCDRVLALDVAPAALSAARRNCPAPHVTFAERRVPEAWPAGRFDLIVLSEVLYYLTADDIAHVAAQSQTALLPGGTILLVHYLGETDYPMTGDDAATSFMSALPLSLLRGVREDLYRIDVLGTA